MGEKWTREKFDEVRESQGDRIIYLPFLYLSYKEGGNVETEILDDTFTQFFKGEKGFDGRICSWDQPQILVFDLRDDNRKKAFKLNEYLAGLMWKKVEDNGLDPLDMKGIVFSIEREGYDYSIEIKKKEKGGEDKQEGNTASRDDIKAVVLNVIEDNPEMNLKEIFLWSKEHLKEEGQVDDTLLKEVISELLDRP